MVGMEGGHEKGSLAFAYEFRTSFREGNMRVLMFCRPAKAEPGGGRWTPLPATVQCDVVLRSAAVWR